MASFSSGNDNFTASNSKQGNQSSFNTTQQAAITELENKTAAIANSLQDTINDLNDFKEETAADLGTKQDRLIPGSHVAINEANIISSNQINDSAVSSTETYSSDKIKSITDAIENKVNTKANISYVDTNFENISELIDTKQDKLTAGSGITISDNTISTLNYIDDNKPVDNKSYSSSKTVQLDKDVYNNLYEYINSANYDGTILRIDSDGNRFGSIIHAYSGITPGTYGTKDYADATQLACFTINSEGHTTGVRLDEIYPPVTAGKTYDYWMSNGYKRGNWQTPDSRPIDGSRNLITSGAVWTAVKHKGVFEAGLNIDISDYVISCTAIDNETISDTKTFSSSKIQNDMQQLDESINNIEALIPAQATEENILADRDFVNSSINSVTAFYITSDTEGSPFATKAALDNAAAYYYAGAERVPTANDYCVVLEDETHENATVRYVYQSTETGEGTWAFQYVVNDTPFTSDQLAAINSGITAAKVNKYDRLEDLVPEFTSDQLAAINSGITAAKVQAYDGYADEIASKSDVGHKHSADDITSGVLPVANGGTGVTTQAEINKAFIGNLDTDESDVTDGTEFVSSYTSDNGFAETAEGALNKPYKRKFSKVWNYIKGKISSVLGLTKDTYGGKAASAGTADYAGRLTAFASWNNQYNWDSTNGIRVYVYKITMTSAFNSILVQIYDDINHARCRRYILGLWHVNNYGYNVSVTDLGGAKDNGLKVWMGTDGNVYLQADVYWTSRISFSHLDDITDVTITKIGNAKYGYNKDVDGTVLFTPLTDPIVDCGAIRAEPNLSSAQKVSQHLNTDILYASNVLYAQNKMIIPIGEPSSLENGCIWIS